MWALASLWVPVGPRHTLTKPNLNGSDNMRLGTLESECSHPPTWAQARRDEMTASEPSPHFLVEDVHKYNHVFLDEAILLLLVGKKLQACARVGRELNRLPSRQQSKSLQLAITS